jgi:hypothetical protein
MGLFKGVKQSIVKWLGITDMPTEVNIQITQVIDRPTNTLKNTVWYRGDASEIEQFWQELAEVDTYSTTIKSKFWSSVSSNALVRKIHSGLPRMITDKLAAIVVEDMNDPDFKENTGAVNRWNIINEELNFDEILNDAVSRTLAEGDGAFKICIDKTISDYPLVEFFSGNDVEFNYSTGKLTEIIFYTDYYKGSKHFKLVEMYGFGYVRYKLVDDKDKEYDVTELEETAELVEVEFDKNVMLAVPLKFYTSVKWKHRGESIFEGKDDPFDGFDEVISTWIDAVRAGRVKQYVPEALVPRDEDNGALLKPDVFNPYYLIGSNLSEDNDDHIEVKQGEVLFDGLLLSYTTFLDLCLQGIISPSTLGIDIKKLDNAESQREKEKTTMYTRDTLIGVLAKVLPKLFKVILQAEDLLNKKTPGVYTISFTWGQYANPSFEARVETISKARMSGIMSLERCIDELYGDDLTKELKKQEVEKLKQEEQEKIPAMDEPSFSEGLE